MIHSFVGVVTLGMYLRTIQRRNLDGSTVRYLQFAHNEWDAATRQARAKVIHGIGREDASIVTLCTA